jgi:hypothetical protein
MHAHDAFIFGPGNGWVAGPLEVLTAGSIRALASRLHSCNQHCPDSAPHLWGEDTWLSNCCLPRLLAPCSAYFRSTGCGWTRHFQCPYAERLRTHIGVAINDGTIGYHCCCTASGFLDDASSVFEAALENKAVLTDGRFPVSAWSKADERVLLWKPYPAFRNASAVVAACDHLWHAGYHAIKDPPLFATCERLAARRGPQSHTAWVGLEAAETPGQTRPTSVAMLYHGAYYRHQNSQEASHTWVGFPKCTHFFAAHANHEANLLRPLRAAGVTVSTFFHTFTSGCEQHDARLVRALEPVRHAFVEMRSTRKIVSSCACALGRPLLPTCMRALPCACHVGMLPAVDSALVLGRARVPQTSGSSSCL